MTLLLSRPWQYECDGKPVRPADFNPVTCANITLQPIEVCICPLDSYGVICSSRRTLSCTLASDTCSEMTSPDPILYRPDGSVRDYERYDWRLPGDPVCHVKDCSKDKMVISADIQCGFTDTFDIASFSQATRLPLTIIQSTLDSFVYIVSGTGFGLTTQPRVYAAVRPVNRIRLFSATQGMGTGMDFTQLVGGSVVSTLAEFSLADYQPLVYGGRMYIEATLKAAVPIAASVLHVHVDCTNTSFGKKPSKLAVAAAVGIGIGVGVFVLALVIGIWRYRLYRNSNKTKKD